MEYKCTFGRNTPEGALLGNRIPKDYFVANGKGESDITIHAGSYHLALKDAGIEMCNIMTYSSILPRIAEEVQKPELIHGAVVESIMAVAHAKQGEKAAAGIGYSWLFDRETGEKYGGLVCEHSGGYEESELEELLMASLNELYTNGFSEKFEMRDVRLITESIVPKKKFGTALVAICFTSYVHPVLKR